MTRYLISFDDGPMTFLDEDLPAVAAASHEAVEQAKDAGVWVTGRGVEGHDVSIAGTDGSVTNNPSAQGRAHIGGFSILDVPSLEEALTWAARIAAACRCAQEVRELQHDPAV